MLRLRMGYTRVGAAADGMLFLEPGASSTWRPLLLLVEDAAMPQRGACYEAGLSRLSLYVADMDKALARLADKGLTPIHPPGGKGGTAAVFHDPDGYCVYLITFHGAISLYVRFMGWWKGARDANPFSCTLNVTDARRANAAFEALGFKTLMDIDKPDREMLPAFGLPRDIGIESIRLALLPSDGFIGTVMEWTSTPKTAATPSNALAISVDDVAAELARAETAGLRTEPAALRSYPVLGEALVGACFVDDCRVEFVRFLDC